MSPQLDFFVYKMELERELSSKLLWGEHLAQSLVQCVLNKR